MKVLDEDGLTLYRTDCSTALREMRDESVQCCVTSPPYWGLRDYRTEGQLGLESTPEQYVEHMVTVFREVRRVLRADGTLWLNIGDSYAASGKGWGGGSISEAANQRRRQGVPGYKQKDLIGVPWMLAFALRADGWYLRSDIVWSKPNPMPESVTDRPTKSHEYVFLLAKSERYYFDQDSVRVPFTDSTIERITQESIDSQEGGWKQEAYQAGFPGKKSRDRKPAEIIRAMAKTHKRAGGGPFSRATAEAQLNHGAMRLERGDYSAGRNIRTVWTIPTAPSPLPHFAAFPDALVEPCIQAGSAKGDTVLDPFAGTGTTLKVARSLGRKAIGIDISEEYCDLAVKRLRYGVKGVLAMGNGQGELLEWLTSDHESAYPSSGRETSPPDSDAINESST